MNQNFFNPLVLIVLDGVGIAQASKGNAVTRANTPFLESAWDTFPHTYLQASEKYVGLPDGVKGNSEVGHMNLGSGRIVFQELPRINKAIENGSFNTNQQFINAINHVQQTNGKLHVALCFSDGGVHATTNHLKAFISMLSQKNFQQPLIIHTFTDGRDTPPKSAQKYFNDIQQFINHNGIGLIGTVTGRSIAMDRNEVWERVERAYNLLTLGQGRNAASWQEALDTAYKREETDEFIEPTIIQNQTPVTVNDGDAFVFLNYRADRAIELTSAFTLQEFPYFNRQKFINNLYFVGMTEYAKELPPNVAFPSDDIALPLGRILSQNDKRQLRIAESEKFPHVTYFFNGGRAIKFGGEDRVEVPSPDVPTYDHKPEMSLPEVTQILLDKLALRIYDFVIINMANGDMVGHTGEVEASIKAMEYVDRATQQIVKQVHSLGGCAIITADHGNVEEVINLETGGIDTEHSINPVPLIVAPPKRISSQLRLSSGKLADVAPTILNLMGLNKSDQMTGNNLFR